MTRLGTSPKKLGTIAWSRRIRLGASNVQYFLPRYTKAIKLSTFVLVFAYAGSCIAEAKGVKGDMKVYFGFTADCRTRLDPPVPANYFGNCVSAHLDCIESETLMVENGTTIAAEMIGQVNKGLEKADVEKVTETLGEMKTSVGAPVMVSIVGSPRFKVYETDFEC
uniref:Uncharacterized protein n=1 Tax=Rhizophora mucronata TaxID=61149 RepID=A0A2P2IPF3_RHIMU